MTKSRKRGGVKTPATARILRQLAADKNRFGVHRCCGCLVTGPHSYDCRVAHPGPRYAEELNLW